MSRRPRLPRVLALCLSALILTTACSDEPAPTDTKTPDTGHEDTGHDDTDVGHDADVRDDDASSDASEPITDPNDPRSVEESARFELEGLRDEVHVVRTTGDIPHIYAGNRHDLALVHGFVAARHRYFMMDLMRRLGLGRVAELLGDSGLDSDIQSRMTGSRFVAERMVATASDEILEVMDAYAAGVNAYIEHVEAGLLPAPSEVDVAYGLLGASRKVDVMKPFDRLDVAAMLTVFVYQSGFETTDLGTTDALARLEGAFDGKPFAELREAGALEDIVPLLGPVMAVASGDWQPASSLRVERPAGSPGSSNPGAVPVAAGAEATMVRALRASIEAQHERMGWRAHEKGFGSNAWAVTGAASTDGASLLAADGHLQLGIPSILYQVGLDTSVFGGGDIHQLGMVIPGLPVVALGTNGRVAWSFTQVMGDITDWYREELQLDEDGLPHSSRFGGEWKPLEASEEIYEVANVPALGSVGRTDRLMRWTTFDGRWLLSVEGRAARGDEVPGEGLEPGEALVRTHSGWVIPGDVDGDGVVTAVSFDYTALDTDNLLGTFDAMGRAGDVHEFREATRGLIATSLNFTVSDDAGNAYYSAYQAVPCRGYLPRDDNGDWMPGANPTVLLDGTTYGGFTIPTLEGKVVETFNATDPYRCVVPHAEMPQRLNPESGYVQTANNDPAGIAFDHNLHNDPWYIGGPWDLGFRADTIDRELRAIVEAGEADIEAMQRLQANHRSRLGERFAPYLIEALAQARAHAEADDPDSLEPWKARLAAHYADHAQAFDEVAARLEGWAARGFQAKSGVETFYQSVTADDREDAVATMIFNAWFGRFVGRVFDDEGIPYWPGGGTAGRIRTLDLLLRGRDDAQLPLASRSDLTGESIFFDVVATPEVETSREVMLGALDAALVFLSSEPTGRGEGGFGTDDMDRWLWGLRHYVRFESLLASYLDDQPLLANLVDQFSITTNRLPLAEGMPTDDPRRDLKWFPRDGDQYAVDAANPGLGGVNFSYGSGPVMRMVVALKDGQVRGYNVIPGGQSGLRTSPHFADQARLWLANDALPMRFHVADVTDGALGREVYRPR